MKLFSFFLVIFLATFGCTRKLAQTGSSAGTNTNWSNELHVLCYNIHHASPPSKPGVIDLDAIAKVIRQSSPDIVALQEVDVNTNRSGKTSNQAEDLARLSGMPHYYFAKAINYDGGEYGVAILSRLPLSNMKNTPLPTAAGTNGEPRTLATAEVTLPNRSKFVFACTHLDAQRSDTNRLLQVQKIGEVLKQEKLTVVIAGDFNAVAGGEVINILDQSFTRSCIQNCGFTIPVINPTKTIDFVAYKPSTAFTIVKHQVIDEKYASDHLPVEVVLQLK
ncbi:endonuclease [Segetibacter sp. 3557_3]|uniref:endonuclease/exonuclease/phosphatase family protein n=1 Tax=Segetibacter sp. 3557_3 TaxID=2547429 RepID=UPI0010584431|nr:endonuclease/exonuclease/phosphatase family protein [Segetibacter sp. 3557_3]TDH28669.1 endonuclease [Segetibacter sp. 3557_3]